MKGLLPILAIYQDVEIHKTKYNEQGKNDISLLRLNILNCLSIIKAYAADHRWL